MHSLLSFLALALPLASGADAAASSKRWARPGRGGFGDRHGGHQWSALSQDKTNGLSHLGKLDAPRLPHFIDGPHPGGSPRPWGNRDAKNCNPYDVNSIPNTGVTRQYDWTVTNTTLSPDGVELPLLVVNGQFPGPTIEANWGDWIEVTVHNQLVGEYEEGTSIHWHGFLQTGTPYYDSTPGISQCPIAPGKSFTYRFRAELYGTSWWHSHYSSQYVNGLSGPIVVYGPDSDSYDIDVGPVMLSDWFHDYYDNLLIDIFYATETCDPHCPPMSDNMLINGKNNYPCNETEKTCTPNAGLANFKFETGKKHRLRLVNHAAEAIVFFSIDGYDMTVISNDFVSVEPYKTDLVILGVGQRTDVIVQGRDNPKEAVYMRMTEGPSGLGPRGTTGCSLNTGVSIDVVAPIYYEDADTSVLPNTTSDIDSSRYLFPNNCGNEALNHTTPSYAMEVKEPTTQLDFLMTGDYNATGAFVWYMNNITYYTDYNDPSLFEAKLGNYNYSQERQIYNMKNNTVVRINMTSVGFPASHPM
ncbi:laccase-like multicopper oxidase [Hortaea werneckii]|nr:laccase-like multicopper oxidase [Hortaea werneckii]